MAQQTLDMLMKSEEVWTNSAAQQQLQKVREQVLSKVSPKQLAQGLGWFSLGLGAAEIFAPRMVAKLCGGKGHLPMLVQMYGVREIVAGLGILTSPRRPTDAVWSRVAGDMVDLASLGLIFLSPGSNKFLNVVATANVLAVTGLDLLAATELSKKEGAITENGAFRVERSIFINKTPEECYQYWRNFERLPGFMMHLLSVSSLGEGRTHWSAKGPANTVVEWDAELIEDLPNKQLSWKSLSGSVVRNRGSVLFRPATGGRGTNVVVQLEYSPPGGVIGVGIAKLFREDPLAQLKDDLRRFKQIMEVGEVVRSTGSPEGTGQLMQESKYES